MIAVEDLLAMENPSPTYQALLADGIRSCLSIPLISQGDLIGAFIITSGIPGAFTREHAEIAIRGRRSAGGGDPAGPAVPSGPPAHLRIGIHRRAEPGTAAGSRPRGNPGRHRPADDQNPELRFRRPADRRSLRRKFHHREIHRSRIPCCPERSSPRQGKPDLGSDRRRKIHSAGMRRPAARRPE